LIAGCVLGIPALGVLLLRTQLAVVRVRGTSMLPDLRPGDRVLVRHGRPSGRARRLRVGMVIVVRSPITASAPRGIWPVAPRLGWDRWIIKRVAALPGDAVPGAMRQAAGGAITVPERKLLVMADNASGADSRQWGFIQASDVLGPVVKKLDVLRSAPHRRRRASRRGGVVRVRHPGYVSWLSGKDLAMLLSGPRCARLACGLSAMGD
jgi:signal peptidase I